jgi:non-canonical purine NTP pyrophosphatase (RdgB/HAM1 family)
MKSFIFVTQSTDKINEANRILGYELERVKMDLLEVQAVEVEDVVTQKVKFAYDALDKTPVMVEDTGLYIEAWNGLPGALIKWFIKRVGAHGVCNMLKEFPNRNAWAETIVATYDGNLKIYKGKVYGKIAVTPIGEGGFGWDSLFIPNGSYKTFAEMSGDEKDEYSMRRLAFKALADNQSSIPNMSNR